MIARKELLIPRVDSLEVLGKGHISRKKTRGFMANTVTLDLDEYFQTIAKYHIRKNSKGDVTHCYLTVQSFVGENVLKAKDGDAVNIFLQRGRS